MMLHIHQKDKIFTLLLYTLECTLSQDIFEKSEQSMIIFSQTFY
ncbi:hypothetical protein HMPREF0813_01165 [Streptococcus anginosus F0211]|uniref:Uncharacterized protein n=1 Tax=Streptococcus anginosus F0211 TaxID=706437 RepID=E6J1N8_STRAP|nr:hypothetical protein HMPREF0813_01165 [Streptococcus anginosus F0211]ETS94849.1 hypothetical protein HMPREF1512_1301 [Streptococcus sp. OBRC6]EUB12474.1 hypothetical protein HMPREF1510_1693 [Streptococcus sp. ACC21]EUC77220.1 hypothetical protein HMPREF1511_2033 [Streptococcus sp. CM7]